MPEVQHYSTFCFTRRHCEVGFSVGRRGTKCPSPQVGAGRYSGDNPNNPIKSEAIQKKRFFGFHPQNDIAKKAAFTLAEVLITLGIIGIVAAMTLPTLINNYKEQEIITRVKKTYTTIAQALELVQAAYETPGDNSILFSKEKSSAEITKELSKYFSGARRCQFSKYSCRAEKSSGLYEIF